MKNHSQKLFRRLQSYICMLGALILLTSFLTPMGSSGAPYLSGYSGTGSPTPTANPTPSSGTIGNNGGTPTPSPSLPPTPTITQTPPADTSFSFMSFLPKWLHDFMVNILQPFIRFVREVVRTVTGTDPGSGSPTPTPDPNGTPTPTTDPNGTPTPTTDPNGTPTPTPTTDPNGTPTPTTAPNGTPTPTTNPNGTSTPTPTTDPNGTPTPTTDPNGTSTPTPTTNPNGTSTPTPTPTATSTPTPTSTSTPTSTPTSTAHIASHIDLAVNPSQMSVGGTVNVQATLMQGENPQNYQGCSIYLIVVDVNGTILQPSKDNSTDPLTKNCDYTLPNAGTYTAKARVINSMNNPVDKAYTTKPIPVTFQPTPSVSPTATPTPIFTIDIQVPSSIHVTTTINTYVTVQNGSGTYDYKAIRTSGSNDNGAIITQGTANSNSFNFSVHGWDFLSGGYLIVDVCEHTHPEIGKSKTVSVY